MPLFTEGQDPLDHPPVMVGGNLYGANPAGRMPTGLPEPPPFSGPTSNAIVGAAFRQSNPVISVLDALSRSRPDMTPVPGYDPVKRLSGTKDDDLIEQSLADVNPAQTDARIAKKQAEHKDQETLAAAGWPGTAASVAAGALDPSWFVPIVGELRAGAELGIAARAMRGAVEGAGKAAISEAGLQASQVTRTPGESVSAIATNTILMGLIGGGAAWFRGGERAAAVEGLDKVREDLSPPAVTIAEDGKPVPRETPAPRAPEKPARGPLAREVAEQHMPWYDKGYRGEPQGGNQAEQAAWERGALDRMNADRAAERAKVPDAEVSAPTLARSLSAAESDKRTMKLARILLPENFSRAIGETPIIGPAYNWTAATLMRFSPTLRIFSSDSLVAKRAMGDLAETSLRFTQSEQGITTAQGGVPIDRISKMQQNKGRMDAAHILRDAFVEYRGQEDKAFPLVRSAVQDFRGQAPGKMSYDEFKTEVTLAASNGDVHEVPQVAAAAQKIRAQVLDPVAKMAQQVLGPDGKPMLGEELSPPKGDKSYFPRSYNKVALAAKYNEIKARWADWLQSEQAKKAAAKDRLQLYNDALQSHEATIAKLEGQIEVRGDRLEAIENRQEEIQRLNKFAYQRSAEMTEPLDQMRQTIRSIEAQIQPHLDKLERLAADIRAEKEQFPEIKEADATIFRMIGAAQKLKQSKEIVDTIENAVEYSNALQDTIAGFKGGIREASAQAKLARRDLGADTLVDLEKARADLRKEIKPYLKKLNETRRDLRETREGRIGAARGGAVFETEIRKRGNVLAEQASGKAAQIDDMEQRLIRETANRDAMRTKIEKEIADWEGQSSAEAKSALKVRAEAEAARAQKIAEGTYEGKGARLTGADNAVDRAVGSILSSARDLSRKELEDRASEIIHRINVAPDGRLAYDAGGGGEPIPTGAQQVRGSLNNRDFAIPTSLVKDVIHTDTEHVIAGHLRATIPDIHLTDRFGDIEMTDVMRRVNEEYDAKLAGAGERQSVKLDNERKAMVRDLAATRDRIRGVYGFNLAASQPTTARIANVARNWNLLADLGTSVFNRLTDSTNAVWRHGLINVFNDGYRPFLTSMLGMEGGGGAARQSMKDMGVGIDSHLGHLSHQWGDVIDNYLPGSKFERAMTWAADKSMIVNLHGPWTDSMKTIAGTVAAADFLRMAERVAGGQQTAQDVQRLAQAGIAPHMAERIWKAYADGGGEEFGRGTHVANTADWADKQARDVFTAAIARDADLAVLTPGAEKPLWMSSPVVSLLGQFKSFVAAAHEKILISNLQQADGRTLQGLIAALGMGMLSYRTYTLWSGAPASDRPQDWIKEGISRSAIGGWYTELNSIQAKFTGGNTDAFRIIGADHPLSRRQSNSALSEMLGPTYSRLEGIAGGLNDASHGTWTAMDTHKIRQAMWLQNLFVTRRLLDAVEDGFNESIGVKPLNRDPSVWPGGTVH